MIESIEFTNFKALRKTTLALSPFTLLLGPNGSGKSTVLQALRGIASFHSGRNPADDGLTWSSILSVTTGDRNATVEIKLRLRFNDHVIIATYEWQPSGKINSQLNYENGGRLEKAERGLVVQ